MARLKGMLAAVAALALLAGCQSVSEMASRVAGTPANRDLPPPTNPPLEVPRDRSTLPQPVTGADAAGGRGAAHSARQILRRAGEETGNGGSGTR